MTVMGHCCHKCGLHLSYATRSPSVRVVSQGSSYPPLPKLDVLDPVLDHAPGDFVTLVDAMGEVDWHEDRFNGD